MAGASLDEAVTPCPGCGLDVPLAAAACPHCAAPADATSPMVPFRRPGDGGAGVVDQQTAAFLRSTLPDLVPADLDDVLGRSAVVRLSERVAGRDGVVRFEPRVALATEVDVTRVRTALRVRPDSPGHLLAAESHRIECASGDGRVLATLGLVWPAAVVRWPDRWRSDASLASPDVLADLFAGGGFSDLRLALDRARAQAAHAEAEWAAWVRTWEAAVPPGLAALADDLANDHYAPTSPARDAALRILAGRYPTADEQVLALLGWFGHAQGPWSGFPVAETAPWSLLETYPHATVVAAVRRTIGKLTPQQTEGAARFLCCWVHPTRQPRRRRTIPEDVRRALWEHVLATGDRDKAERAAHVLGP